MSNVDKALSIARLLLGKEEIQPNNGFRDPVIDNGMRALGFYNGASWCGFAVMYVLNQVYPGNKFLKYLSPSTQLMWANFKKAGLTSQVPTLGAIVIWQDGNGSNGHTGLVSAINGNTFKSIEGNSNSNSSRNGYEWAENTHTLGLPHKDAGLNLLGFIPIPA